MALGLPTTTTTTTTSTRTIRYQGKKGLAWAVVSIFRRVWWLPSENVKPSLMAFHELTTEKCRIPGVAIRWLLANIEFIMLGRAGLFVWTGRCGSLLRPTLMNADGRLSLCHKRSNLSAWLPSHPSIHQIAAFSGTRHKNVFDWKHAERIRSFLGCYFYHSRVI